MNSGANAINDDLERTIAGRSCRMNNRSAEELNRLCPCPTTRAETLKPTPAGNDSHAYADSINQETLSHFFASVAVFVTKAEIERMQAIISSVERVAALGPYQSKVLGWAPPIAGHNPGGALGVFMGYDFHIGKTGPQLIEINTNAGGAFLNSILIQPQKTCCGAPFVSPLKSEGSLDDQIVQMFESEWHRQDMGRALSTIAIVDESPQDQHLFPDFVLARQLFQSRGYHAMIADPSELVWKNGQLWHQEQSVDLVYNRLTDFPLEHPKHNALKAAYLNNAIVLTPHPRTYALFADKRNLTLLSDAAQLKSWGADDEDIDILEAGIPPTIQITEANAEAVWRQRKNLFFKPAHGFGSRAAYRGDKVTQKTWANILKDRYVAQQRVAPAHRTLKVDGQDTNLKFDIRAYAYHGEVQMIAARLYQGQTTNFRTRGGGFAPVLYVD